VLPNAGWAGLICHTYQHYHCQWLPNTEWSDSKRWTWGRDRWLWRTYTVSWDVKPYSTHMEGKTLRKQGF